MWLGERASSLIHKFTHLSKMGCIIELEPGCRNLKFEIRKANYVLLFSPISSFKFQISLPKHKIKKCKLLFGIDERPQGNLPLSRDRTITDIGPVIDPVPPDPFCQFIGPGLGLANCQP